MTEREYIDATNLAKVRAAKTVLLDFLPMDEQDEADYMRAQQAMRHIEERLEKRVRTEES